MYVVLIQFTTEPPFPQKQPRSQSVAPHFTSTSLTQECTQGGGGALGARVPPLPPGKQFRSEMSERGEKVPPRYVGKQECARSA